MLEFVDPRAQPGAPIEAYTLRIDPGAGPLKIGLLANGFPDSVAFLQEIEQVLKRDRPGLEFRHYNKGDPSIVLPDGLVQRIAEETQAVIAAYGH